ncbi:IS1182 family transposase [Streptomyces sp. NL15-2K]|uniref:IS1182 family transposase n=2 Tax=Streptomyces sp. NL15-2K TaxID=376149 RepID=UPI0026EA42BA|nr:IS1182 family transposase [Kutzneria buriramensis]WKX05989.1 IS1182 family transposase [Kutzneria buriramensis]WKX08308.1 IS1182 family transposase [Kutzneria buriramensis]WKX12131.1 IS1182 family transposase [Kutzneria buriramensis]WKX14047.1 IS1182 family transposase [Kutzneria buriramensis]WKX14288.1 IS1182 family transposase [Kutzneria buriramensis]
MQGEWAGEMVGPDVWETCRELIPAGSVFAFLAEHREALFPPSMFADMYPSSNGRPSLPPQVLAATVVLQSLQGLSDFETVQELRCDLRWKAACGLGLYDMAFDPSLLTYFRRRLRHSAEPMRIFTKVKEVVAATGVLKGKQRRAVDSTVLDDAVATQDTVTQIVSAIRRVIRDVPGAQEAAAEHCRAHDYTDPGKPKIAWNDEQARAALVDALVTDALNLLGRLPDRELGEKAANAMGLLALVAGQDVEPAEDSDGRDGRWRIARRTAPDRTVSTVDPDARHIHKNRTRHQDGFKGHVSFEPESGLFTAVAVTGGYGPGNHEAAVARDLLDGEDGELTVLGDSAYGTGELREQLQAAGHTLVIKPPPLRQVIPDGFTIDDFRIDPAAGTATCPAGRTANLGQIKADGARTAQFKRLCVGCPLRERCTTSKTGRTLNIHPQHELLTAARRDAADPAWQAEYRRWRPPVERAIAWLVAKGNRRVPHRGVIANNLWLHHRAAALNLRRLINLGLTRTGTTWHLTPATT